jgi:hypothetical protein
VLFGLFLCFRFFPKWLVNLLLSGYITLLGAFAINAVALPFVAKLFSEETQHKVSPKPVMFLRSRWKAAVAAVGSD